MFQVCVGGTNNNIDHARHKRLRKDYKVEHGERVENKQTHNRHHKIIVQELVLQPGHTICVISDVVVPNEQRSK